MSRQGDLLLMRARPKIAADGLSARELEVAQRFASGDDYKTIAQVLLVSPSTIRGHLTKIYVKPGINEQPDCRDQADDALTLQTRELAFGHAKPEMCAASATS